MFGYARWLVVLMFVLPLLEVVPDYPVYPGEIQCRALGVSLYAYNDEGLPVEDELGEMIIDKPMPSMPIYFWNDENNKRYISKLF